MHPKDAAGIANSVDPDQTAPLALSVRKFRIITVICSTEVRLKTFRKASVVLSGLLQIKTPQDYKFYIMRKPINIICKQQRCRSACAGLGPGFLDRGSNLQKGVRFDQLIQRFSKYPIKVNNLC